MSGLKVESNIKIMEKCGEIFREQDCANNCGFTIICTECNMKVFYYQDFLDHFQIMHIKEIKVPVSDFEDVDIGLSELCELDDTENLKEEIFEENIRTTETIELPINEKKDFLRPRRKKAKYVEPDTVDFESITLEQTNSTANDTDDLITSEDENILQTDTDETNDFEKEHKKSTKKRRSISQQEKVHKCDQCDKAYFLLGNLKKHIKYQHPIEKIFNCNQCDHKSFSDERTLSKHVRLEHGKIKCSLCEKSYVNASSLREHIQSHHEKCNYICDFKNCSKSYKSLQKLQRHKRTHVSDLKHVCEFCGYRTREKNVLVVHLRTHSGEKPFPCSICGKRFISQSMVAEHQATHAKDRQHKCDVCGATFSRPKALYHHKHLHLGIKKFVCRICEKAYSQAAGLSAHMRQHKVDGKIM